MCRAYHYDYRGSTVALTDIKGTVTDLAVYGTYGELVQKTGATWTPFLYDGKDGIVTDSNGLYYMRSRYYNPDIRRFMNQDVITGSIGDSTSLNRYSFVNGNPTDKVDPSGQFAFVPFLLKAGAGAVTDLLMQVTLNYYFNPETKYNFGKSFKEVNWWQVGIAAGESLVGLPGKKLGKAIYSGMAEVAKKGLNAYSRKKNYTIYQGFMDFSDGVISSLAGDALGAALKKFGKHINVPKKNCQGKQTVVVKNQGKCFVAGTLVSTEDGLRAIETVKAGDLVYAEQPESGKIALKRVVETYIRETDTLIEVRIGKEVIKTTEEHPFWVEGEGWVNAKDLETGDVVRLQSGKTDVILSVELIHLDHLIKVYNFQVEDFHTYFVTALKVLVHNAGCGGKGELHHIASDKSIVSGFTMQYEKIFKRASMSLQDKANLIFLENHNGAHTKVYKQYVLDYLETATEGLKGVKAKEALTAALEELKKQLIKNPKMPYKGGL